MYAFMLGYSIRNILYGHSALQRLSNFYAIVWSELWQISQFSVLIDRKII